METTIELNVGAGFGRWLAQADATLVVTTYQAGKIVLVDHDGERAQILVKDLVAPMGLAIDGDRLGVAVRDRVLVYADSPDLARTSAGRPPNAFEHVYAPHATHRTGDIRAHEIAFGREGLWIVNTRYSSLCLASLEHSCEPKWRPAFVSASAPEDRCHLSGLAMEHGAPAYVTAHAVADTPGGWRDRKVGGGVVVEVATGKPLAGGFTMPHSPRLAHGALWVLDSGQGVLARIDRATGAPTAVARVPGFARGLCFHGDHALVGLSKIREAAVFGGLPVAERGPLHCGVAVVDARSGQVEGALRFTSGCEEIFDVTVLPGRHRVQLLDAPG